MVKYMESEVKENLEDEVKDEVDPSTLLDVYENVFGDEYDHKDPVDRENMAKVKHKFSDPKCNVEDLDTFALELLRDQ